MLVLRVRADPLIHAHTLTHTSGDEITIYTLFGALPPRHYIHIYTPSLVSGGGEAADKLKPILPVSFCFKPPTN